jgi:GYF domain 2
MKSYSLKLSGREAGPYTETQVAQMFADGRVNRHTPCKVAGGSEWKTVDDYLPMLKYGT